MSSRSASSSGLSLIHLSPDESFDDACILDDSTGIDLAPEGFDPDDGGNAETDDDAVQESRGNVIDRPERLSGWVVAALVLAAMMLVCESLLVWINSGQGPGALIPWADTLRMIAGGLVIAILVCGVMMRRSDRRASAAWDTTAASIQQLSDEQQRYGAVLKASVDGVIVADDSCRIVEFNPAAESIFGLRRGEAIGRNLVELIFADAADAERHGITCDGACASGRRLGRRFEATGKRCNGAKFPMELAVRRTRLPGERVVHTAFVQDIGERKRAEQALRESEAQNRALLEAIPDVMLHFKDDGELIQVKARARNGMAIDGVSETVMGVPAAMVHEHISEVLPAQLVDHFLSVSKEAMRSNKAQSFECRIRRKGRSAPRFFEARISPVNGDEVMALLREITDRKLATQELREAKARAEDASRAKSEFLANMSHEIRTPMTAIVGYADMLSRPDQDGDELANWASAIRQNADYLLSLVNDILDLSKIEAGRVTLHTRPTNIVHALNDVASLMKQRANDKGLSFDVEYDGLLPERFETDPLRFRQIMVNLVSNAVKFTDSGGVKIRVSTSDRDQGGHRWLSIAVEDSGVGIPQKKMAQLFSPFTQLHASAARRAGGTGLGLTIVKHFVELLDGSVDVQSQPNQGSVFTVRFDLGASRAAKLVDPATVAARQALPAPAAASTAGGRVEEHIDEPRDTPARLDGVSVLVVDDNPDNQNIITFLLERAGAAITRANNGKLGVDAATHGEFDLILMDMQMPVMDGYQATSLLRERGIRTPIIALTAYAMAGDETGCLTMGCDDYISKPIEPDRFFATIREHVRVASVSPAVAAPESLSGGEDDGEELSLSMLEEDSTGNDELSLQSEVAVGAATNATPDVLESTMADDPTFAPLLEKYQLSMIDAIQNFDAARQSGDVDAVARIVHQFRGTASNYGYPMISEAAGKVEDRLRSGATLDNVTLELDHFIDLLFAATAAAELGA